ncbi:4-hydroxy-tetrahydrodipicolinate synthase [Bradyrhizobium lablabi]|uniref:4-hydroxy-tetrahydrodipicolinate synthase n=1 Tax=Bradyrhizobium lablabi TaxID=722472 RepID=UPI000909B5C1|nr:4-hydroxy-tetrahydrodipicolinate synthase [Bradyrhizobium lablabi]SHK84053.1 4-hydroxy-tetrahydrodipicolinate synthase [Bradyrhizobium lablabi]
MTLHQPMHWLGGFIADLPTPFDDGDRVDWPAFETLCERQIGSGATAIVVGETMGEDSTLGRDEHEEIVAAAVDIARGRVAVIAGAGSNATGQAMELTTMAEAAGADAILSVVPYYNKPMQAGILAHFQAIVGVTGLPVILHDVPSRTMREISDETIVRLSESRQFIGLKDATGSVARLMRLKPTLPPMFRFLSGDDATTPAYLASGGNGCISMVANLFPELCHGIYEGCMKSHIPVSEGLSARIAALVTALSADSEVAALKYGLSCLGLVKPAVRLPLVELGDDARKAVALAMTALCEDKVAADASPRRLAMS